MALDKDEQYLPGRKSPKPTKGGDKIVLPILSKREAPPEDDVEMDEEAWREPSESEFDPFAETRYDDPVI